MAIIVIYYMALVYLGIAKFMAIKLFWRYVSRPIEAWCRARLGELPYMEQPADLNELEIAYTHTIDMQDDEPYDRDLGSHRHER